MGENLIFYCNDFTDPDNLATAMAIWKTLISGKVGGPLRSSFQLCID
ncbi:hypothetical protein FOPG_20000 [Fusarium oxysporum f. sp. conglutinans race 2 54008]|uniref:Uncharacterized protein n=1 Tax=Fusarium oxysporum f. sp. conglutinans race 2 54008 TaxID=1089457 RepID=X0GJ95_FUSOX|nr:hypothetical protein FOPG_20000 [Fusarium oxysporum f. sp. conglutinans race 2 54008]